MGQSLSRSRFRINWDGGVRGGLIVVRYLYVAPLVPSLRNTHDAFTALFQNALVSLAVVGCPLLVFVPAHDLVAVLSLRCTWGSPGLGVRVSGQF
jgi:hypothetical protein